MTVDADQSAIRFTAHQTFSSTDGHFGKWGGDFAIDRDDLSASKVSVRIDAASIDTDNGTRDDHLRSEDFFFVKKYPSITFDSTKIEPLDDGRRVRVSGTLAVRDKKKKVSFVMSLEWKGDRLHAFGRMTVDRFDLGLTYEAPFYTPDLKRNVNLTFDVSLMPAKG